MGVEETRFFSLKRGPKNRGLLEMLFRGRLAADVGGSSTGSRFHG
jgi:hypothetical protein